MNNSSLITIDEDEEDIVEETEVLDSVINNEQLDIANVEPSLVENEVINIPLNGEVQTVPVIEKPKGKRGRPRQHDFSGRVYLIKDEIEQAMTDKDGFIALMNTTYYDGLADDRRATLGAVLDTPTALSFTINGPIRQVIDQLHQLRAVYGEKAKVNISKERLLTPGDALYVAPIKEVIGERNGKPVYKHIFEEFRSSTIYGYCTVML